MDIKNAGRLQKLKLVYKKAIQEILKNENVVVGIFDNDNLNKDSFYALNSSKSGVEDEKDFKDILHEKFSILQNKLSKMFVNKIKEYNLEEKLNTLDDLIKENKITKKEVTSDDYIEEILHSYIVDDMAEYTKSLENLSTEITNSIGQLQTKLEESQKIYNELSDINRDEEMALNSLMKNINMTLDTK